MIKPTTVHEFSVCVALADSSARIAARYLADGDLTNAQLFADAFAEYDDAAKGWLAR